jgi:hypothetical protein
MTETISLHVDSDTARIFMEAPPEERLRLELLLGLRLRELATKPIQPLNEIMAEMSREAADRGLTPEILDDLLRDVS